MFQGVGVIIVIYNLLKSLYLISISLTLSSYLPLWTNVCINLSNLYKSLSFTFSFFFYFYFFATLLLPLRGHRVTLSMDVAGEKNDDISPPFSTEKTCYLLASNSITKQFSLFFWFFFFILKQTLN